MYLVTGCAGFVGFNTCELLLKNNKRVIGIDSLNIYYSKAYKLKRLSILKKNNNFEFHKFNLCDSNKLKEIFKNNKITHVIHLAAQPGVVYSYKNPKSYSFNNVSATKSLIKILKIFEPNNFIFSSSSSVYGDHKKFPIKENFRLIPKNHYAKTKVKCEKLIKTELKNTNISIKIIRPFTVYGPYGRPDMLIIKMLSLIDRAKALQVYNYGKHLRDFTYIYDLVNIIYQLSKKRDPKIQTFNICASKPIEINSILTLTKKYLKKDFKINFLRKRKGEMKITYGSNKKLLDYIKYKKFTSIEDGIKQTIKWYKNFPQKKLFTTYK
jgi:UDP-glucuronate 4-epimerase